MYALMDQGLVSGNICLKGRFSLLITMAFQCTLGHNNNTFIHLFSEHMFNALHKITR